MVYRSIGQRVYIPLFKYYGNIEYAKDAIENSRIHLEPPSMYNDIYDSSFAVTTNKLYCTYSSQFFTTEFLRKYYEFIADDEIEALKKKNLSFGELVDYLCNKNEKIKKEDFIKDCLLVASNGEGIVQADNNKISCFSEVNDSLLMWAYYAKNYSGVCIRFNALKDTTLLEHCRKVQYTNHYISDNTFGHYFRKSIQWAHEQEWRIVCDTKEEYIPVNSIDAIYLGKRMEEYIINDFIELGEKYKLEVYMMNISKTKYEILFDKLL